MSQLVVPNSDVSPGNFTPTPIWDQMDVDQSFISADVFHDSSGSEAFSVGLTTLYPPQAGTYRFTMRYNLEVSVGYPGIIECDLSLNSNSGCSVVILNPPTGFRPLFTTNATNPTQTVTYDLTAEEIENLLIHLVFGTQGEAQDSTLQVGINIGDNSALAGPGDTFTFRVFYIKLETPDGFVYGMVPSTGPKAGGTAATLSARGIGLLATNPADLRIQFSTDYNEITPTVVDDDTVTLVTPANSIDTPADPIPGGDLPLLFAYDSADGTRSMNFSKIPSAFTANIWTYTEAVAPFIEMDETLSAGAVVFSGDGNFGSSHQVTPEITGGIKVAGRSQFQFLSASVPSTQLGDQWRLDQFHFKYQSEEES